MRPHHRFMLAQHLSHIDFLDEAIDQLDQQIQEQMRPFAAALATWDSLPGINQRLAEIIVAEIGADLEPFEDADHLASWAGMCPGNNESAGKRKSGRTRKGSPWLRRALIEAATAPLTPSTNTFRRSIAAWPPTGHTAGSRRRRAQFIGYRLSPDHPANQVRGFGRQLLRQSVTVKLSGGGRSNAWRS